MQVQKTKAREAEIVLPWEKAGNSEISSTATKQVGGHPKDVTGLGFNSVANYYGRLDHKMDRITASPPSINMKKLQTVHQDSAVSLYFLTERCLDEFSGQS